ELRIVGEKDDAHAALPHRRDQHVAPDAIARTQPGFTGRLRLGVVDGLALGLAVVAFGHVLPSDYSITTTAIARSATPGSRRCRRRSAAPWRRGRAARPGTRPCSRCLRAAARLRGRRPSPLARSRACTPTPRRG